MIVIDTIFMKSKLESDLFKLKFEYLFKHKTCYEPRFLLKRNASTFSVNFIFNRKR